MSGKARIVGIVAIVSMVLVGVAVPLVLAQDTPPRLDVDASGQIQYSSQPTSLPIFESPPPGPEWPPVPDVDVGGLVDFVSAVGLGAVITVVIEILKQLQLVPDGQAGRWATIANIVAFAGFTIAGVFGVEYAGDQARAIYDLIYRIGQAILSIISSPIIFRVLRDAGVMPQMPSRE